MKVTLDGRAYPLVIRPDYSLAFSMGELRKFKRYGVENAGTLTLMRILQDPDATAALADILKTRNGEKFDPAAIDEINLVEFELEPADPGYEAERAEPVAGNPTPLSEASPEEPPPPAASESVE